MGFFFTASLFTSISILFSVITLVYTQNCRSFENKLGNCISIRRCPQALHLIEKEDGFVSGENVRRLQKVTCGFQGEDPKVCCPLSGSRTGSNGRQVSPAPRSTFSHQFPSLSQCGEQKLKIADRIIGGKGAPIGFFPWLARIGYRVPNSRTTEYFCGGSIISKRYVLTAAHCTVGESESSKPVSVRLGEHDITKDPDCSEVAGCSYIQDYKVIEVISHERYSSTTKKNDIALLKLDRDIEFSNFIQPICLPFVNQYNLRSFPTFDNDQNNMGIVAGWGRTRFDRAEESQLLQYVEVPIVPNPTCNDIYRGKAAITSSQLCAGGEEGEDSCDGDSGGPLVHSIHDDTINVQRFFLKAIVSYGPTKCGSAHLPGIYTRVAEYVTWIQKNAED